MYEHIYGKTAAVGLAHNGNPATVARRLETMLAAAFDRLLTWQDRARSRRLLRGLDDHMLHDIGINRSLAEQEGAVPFWR